VQKWAEISLSEAVTFLICVCSNDSSQCQLSSDTISRPHTMNNIVNIRRIDNSIDRVRSCIDVLTEILTVFRKNGNHFIHNRCIDLVIILGTWLIQTGRADTGTMAYPDRHGTY